MIAFVSDFITSSLKYYDLFGYVSLDTSNIFIEGPFKIYSLYDDDTIKVTTINYHIVSDGKVRNVVSLYLNQVGTLNGGQGVGYADKINKLSDKSAITLIEDNQGLYALLSDNSKVLLEDYSYINNLMNDEIKTIESDDLNTSKCADIITYNNNFKIFKYKYSEENHIMASRSITVPLVTQGLDDCHDACIASVVRAREPNLYGNLTASQVSVTIGDLTLEDRADFIKTKMHDYYGLVKNFV